MQYFKSNKCIVVFPSWQCHEALLAGVVPSGGCKGALGFLPELAAWSIHLPMKEEELRGSELWMLRPYRRLGGYTRCQVRPTVRRYIGLP